MRKIIVIAGILLLVAAGAFLGFRYYKKINEKPVIQTFSTKQNPAYKAVPPKCPLIVEIKNTQGFCKALESDHPIIKKLREIPEVDSLFLKINGFNDFAADHSGINNLLENKSVIISINPTGKNQLSSLYLVQMNSQSESASAPEAVSSDLGSEYVVTRKNYDNTTIYHARSAGLSFFYACANDIFMVSEDFILVEQAIRQTNSQNLLDNHEFTELYKTIEENAFANIFINHLTIHQLLAKFVSPEMRKTVNQLDAYSDWSGMDLSLKTAEIELNGFSVTEDSSDHYLNLFRHQEAQKMTIEKAIPVGASYFVALNLKNSTTFIDQYETYLKANGQFYPREMSLMEFQKQTKTDPIRLFKDIAGTQFAGVYTTINKSIPGQNRFFVAEIINEAEAKDKLSKAVSEFRLTSKDHSDDMQTTFSTNSKNSFNIYKLPVSNMAESLFGKAFAGINGNYFVVYHKYLIWGDNLPGMKSYLESLVAEKTLANDSVYKEYIKGSQPKANFYMYAKLPKVFRLKEVLLRPELSAHLSSNEEAIRKFSILSWQFSVSGDKIKNRVNLRYDPNIKEEPQAIWQLKLDGQLALRPKLVLNHKDTANREVIVSDKMQNVYLINKEGNILWKMTTPDPIISDIHQIDIYQNKKYQYVFNTKTQLFVIDRMGNNVGKFPVIFKSMASNGVTVTQYMPSREFRYFVAGEDKKIYVYDRDGRLLPKWNFEGTQSQVTRPIRHFDIEGKDYIMVTDQQNTYFLDRQGKTRDIQAEAFTRSGNPTYYFDGGNPRLISTDPQGRIHIQDFTGKSEVKELGKFSASHRFTVEDMDGNGSPEYLLTDGKKLTVFGSDNMILFEKTFPDVITEAPIVSNPVPGVTRIGIVTKGENKIYLLDGKGAMVWGFPLAGNTSFVLGKFNDSSSYMNLLVGSEDGSLIN
ncbi:MAG TPA: hypothetical protein VFG54_00580, partial [Prolixibacteraceae bacterium]|nr:hypothetical protein [Prolixibacteraceae bacterium]